MILKLLKLLYYCSLTYIDLALSPDKLALLGHIDEQLLTYDPDFMDQLFYLKVNLRLVQKN